MDGPSITKTRVVDGKASCNKHGKRVVSLRQKGKKRSETLYSRKKTLFKKVYIYKEYTLILKGKHF